eukprot:m.307788 g.307788  ORF g.307788 m.307788 type:complete len:373 (+) comp42824_c0_seq1:114-1232(+)
MEGEAAEAVQSDAIDDQEKQEKQEVQPRRIRVDADVLAGMSREDLLAKWIAQDAYLDYSEANHGKAVSEEEVASLRESEAKLQMQQQESTRRENVLVMRLATKEHEMQDLMSQVHELKQGQTTLQLRSMLLDPAVNVLFQKMQAEITELKSKVTQAQDDLSAWKFTPDSVTGKKLMAKCRNLVQENQDLGKQMSQGRISQLESELAVQKQYTEELKASQSELTEVIVHMEEEVESLGSTILFLQEQLRLANEKVAGLAPADGLPVIRPESEEMEAEDQNNVGLPDTILNGNGMEERRSCDKNDDREASCARQEVVLLDKKHTRHSPVEDPPLQGEAVNDDDDDGVDDEVDDDDDDVDPAVDRTSEGEEPMEG